MRVYKMREALLNEIFSQTGLDSVEILRNETLENKCSTFDEFKVEETVCKNPYVQKALMEELILKKSLKNTYDHVSLNHHFFTGKLFDSENLLDTLEKIYGRIMPIRKDGKPAGYFVSDTSPMALTVIQKLDANDNLDASIRHFLSFSSEMRSGMKDGSAVAIEKISLTKKSRLNLYDNFLEKIIDNDLNITGLASFSNNRLSEGELEKDFFIQGLIERGNKVYLFKEEGVEVLQIYVKKA